MKGEGGVGVESDSVDKTAVCLSCGREIIGLFYFYLKTSIHGGMCLT